MKTSIKISEGSVAEYDTARYIFLRLRLAVRREGDHLHVFRREEGQPFYASAKLHPASESIGSLYIDEGMFSDCVYLDEATDQIKVRGYNLAWKELVDWSDLLGIIQRFLRPEVEIKPSPYMGRGFSQQHYMTQYIEALQGVENENFEFA